MSSWLYPVTMGATTIWERWDSMLPDGSINPGEMTSFNHYALGAVADWMQRTIGGLAPAEPGYRRVEIRPRPGGGLIHARASHLSPYGLIECAWKIEAGKIDLEVVIPPNATALVTLPGSEAAPVEVGSGSWHWSTPYQDPDAHAPYTVDDVIEEIMSDSGARAVVMEAVSRSEGADFLGTILQNYGDLTLRQALGMIPKSGDLLTVMIDALNKHGEQKDIT